MLSDNPEVIVRFGNVKSTFILISERQTVSLTGIKHDKDTQLIIERHQDDILYSNKTHHSNNIFVEKVTVDDFWEFDANFYTPESILDEDYVRHLEKLKDGDWIKKSLLHNTHLFFNGRLSWDIKYPVRRTFLKDINR